MTEKLWKVEMYSTFLTIRSMNIQKTLLGAAEEENRRLWYEFNYD